MSEYEYRIADKDGVLFECRSLNDARDMLNGWKVRKVLAAGVEAWIERREIRPWERAGLGAGAGREPQG